MGQASPIPFLNPDVILIAMDTEGDDRIPSDDSSKISSFGFSILDLAKVRDVHPGTYGSG